MPKSERLRKRYPMLYAFGDRHEFLNTDQAVASTVEERIRSVWPFLVERVMKFSKGMKPRERANCDPEDTLVELYTVLAEKDPEWNPERGKYITFVGVILEHQLCAIRDKARAVHSPRNTTSRIRDYNKREEAGTLTIRRQKTRDRVLGTVLPTKSLAGQEYSARYDNDPADLAEAKELRERELSLLASAVRTLTPLEAASVSRMAGLWGRIEESADEIATSLNRNPEDVKRAKSRGFAKIRDFIQSATV